MYPQTIVDSVPSDQLEDAFRLNELKTTDKSFWLYGLDNNGDGKQQQYKVYTSKDKFYIRFFAINPAVYASFSDGRWIDPETPYWIKVQPIEWLKEPSGIWVSQKGLFVGIQMQYDETSYKCFEKSFMKWYFNKYFSKEMV